VAFAAVIFVGVRFFSLFPKAQPPRIGPAKPPPRPVLHAMLIAVWIGVTLLFALILSGGLCG
jgi:fumarate reductase subunit C